MRRRCSSGWGANKLHHNASKSEFLLLGIPWQLEKFELLKSLTLGYSLVVADAAHKLSVVFDSAMTLDD